jgi:hypothetical protein
MVQNGFASHEHGISPLNRIKRLRISRQYNRKKSEELLKPSVNIFVSIVKIARTAVL